MALGFVEASEFRRRLVAVDPVALFIDAPEVIPARDALDGDATRPWLLCRLPQLPSRLIGPQPQCLLSHADSSVDLSFPSLPVALSPTDPVASRVSALRIADASCSCGS